jgi:hypothetical protein
MKKIFILSTFFVSICIHNAFGKDLTKTQPTQLLFLYYSIKDALVGGNANTASTKAKEFIKAITGVDPKIIGEASRSSLLKEAGVISSTKDLKVQREHFATFSNNMIALAKVVKLSTGPVYQQYCPMKKASWLSDQKAIKNPYYGNAMLSCGEVAATL